MTYIKPARKSFIDTIRQMSGADQRFINFISELPDPLTAALYCIHAVGSDRCPIAEDMVRDILGCHANAIIADVHEAGVPEQWRPRGRNPPVATRRDLEAVILYYASLPLVSWLVLERIPIFTVLMREFPFQLWRIVDSTDAHVSAPKWADNRSIPLGGMDKLLRHGRLLHNISTFAIECRLFDR